MALANDRFAGKTGTLSDPGFTAFAITPADADLPTAVRSLYVGGVGNVAVRTAGGDVVTFVAVPAGTILPIRADRVNSTGTTATNIVGIV